MLKKLKVKHNRAFDKYILFNLDLYHIMFIFKTK